MNMPLDDSTSAFTADSTRNRRCTSRIAAAALAMGLAVVSVTGATATADAAPLKQAATVSPAASVASGLYFYTVATSTGGVVYSMPINMPIRDGQNTTYMVLVSGYYGGAWHSFWASMANGQTSYTMSDAGNGQYSQSNGMFRLAVGHGYWTVTYYTHQTNQNGWYYSQASVYGGYNEASSTLCAL